MTGGYDLPSVSSLWMSFIVFEILFLSETNTSNGHMITKPRGPSEFSIQLQDEKYRKRANLGQHRPAAQRNRSVTARSVRNRFSLLSTKQAQKLREEERASDIDVEQTDLDTLLEEILEREKEAKLKLESQDVEKKNKGEKEKAAAEEIRKQALQRMAKRNSEDGVRQKPAKVRRSTADAIDYLKMRSEKEVEYKKEELEVRKKELQMAAEKQEQANKDQQTMLAAMMTQMQQQQQQQQALQAMLLAQQENQSKILMALIENKKM